MSQARGQGLPGGNRSIADLCSGCWRTVPSVSRLFVQIGSIGIALSVFRLWVFLANYPSLVLRLQVWRIFTSVLVARGVFTGLFALLWITQSSKRLEYERGSALLAHAAAYVTLIGNLLFVVVVGPLGFLGGGAGKFFTNASFAGMWPILFGLMTVRTQLSDEPTTRLCCLPIQVPTKWYPVILVGLFQLFGVQLDLLFGIAGGFIYARRLVPSDERLRALQTGRLLWLAERETFISLDHAGAAPVWNPYTVPGDAGADGGGSAGGGIAGLFGGSGGGSDGGSDGGGGGGNMTASRSAFSGRGYTLGTGEPTNNTGPDAVEVKSDAGRNASRVANRAVLAARAEARLQRQTRGTRQKDKKTTQPEIELKSVTVSNAPPSTTDATTASDPSAPPLAEISNIDPPPEPELRPDASADMASFAQHHEVDLQSFEQMGYGREDALEALVAAGGDFDAAHRHLQGRD